MRATCWKTIGIVILAACAASAQTSGRGNGKGPGRPDGDSDAPPAMAAGGGMGAMAEGPAVGPDGTVYVLRVVNGKTEIAALDVRNGNAKWTAPVDATGVSAPALGKDNRVFLTVTPGMREDPSRHMGVWFTRSGTQAKPKLLVLTPEVTTARITTVEIDADMLSAPRIANDETGNYVVYVLAIETGRDDDNRPAGSELHAFYPDGRLKFKVKLQ